MELFRRARAGSRLAILLLGLGAPGFLGCVSTPEEPSQLLAPNEEQMKLRSFQSRSFDLTDRNQAMRGVIAALQDLGFIIERANESLGVVTGARFDGLVVVGVTVTVRPQPGGSMLIRANAIYNNEPVTDPEVYQNFFATVERSLFVDRN